MKLLETPISGAWLLENNVYQDHRGAFARLFCAREMQQAIGDRTIAQINHSLTRQVGAIRGLHFQHPPAAEMKIVRCLKGRVFDVAVDLRQDSPTFLHWHAVELSPEKQAAFLIPEGCAHGFQVLEPDSELLYLHTAFYTPALEGAVRYDDPKVGVQWPLEPVDLSARDLGHPYLTEEFKGIVV
jgi:dTDP-4-dehydrorhamnose 3,5-epimerase